MSDFNCNLVIDSCCDLPYEAVADYASHIMEFPYQIAREQYFDDLYQSTTAHEFFEGMRNGNEPYTAQIPLATIMAMFDAIVADNKPTVILTFSSGLSGTYATIAHYFYDTVMVEHPDAEIYLIDTKLGSVAEGFLVREACLRLAEGMTARELAEWVKERRWFVNMMFTVDNLDALQRGGRIPSTLAMVASKLDIKPLLTFDLTGNLESCGMVRGRRKALKEMLKYFKNNSSYPNDYSVLIADADDREGLMTLKNLLSEHLPNLEFFETSIGPTVGSHVGPGMLACVFWGADRRLSKK